MRTLNASESTISIQGSQMHPTALQLDTKSKNGENESDLQDVEHKMSSIDLNAKSEAIPKGDISPEPSTPGSYIDGFRQSEIRARFERLYERYKKLAADRGRPRVLSHQTEYDTPSFLPRLKTLSDSSIELNRSGSRSPTAYSKPERKRNSSSGSKHASRESFGSKSSLAGSHNLYPGKERLEEKKKLIEKARSEKELSGCTFNPKINTYNVKKLLKTVKSSNLQNSNADIQFDISQSSQKLRAGKRNATTPKSYLEIYEKTKAYKRQLEIEMYGPRRKRKSSRPNVVTLGCKIASLQQNSKSPPTTNPSRNYQHAEEPWSAFSESNKDEKIPSHKAVEAIAAHGADVFERLHRTAYTKEQRYYNEYAEKLEFESDSLFEPITQNSFSRMTLPHTHPVSTPSQRLYMPAAISSRYVEPHSSS